MFSIKSVYITVPHNSHSTILYVLASMVYVALRQITVQYQMQLNDENTSIHTGASPGFGRGGGQEIFFSDLGICMSRSGMLRMAKPCALLGGFGGMLPRENFLKRCNLVRFRVYFDQILSLFFSKKCHFLYKK